LQQTRASYNPSTIINLAPAFAFTLALALAFAFTFASATPNPSREGKRQNKDSIELLINNYIRA